MTETTNNTPKKKPKDELRSKYANTFKLFDDEEETKPVEVTNVGKLKFNIKDLDPSRDESLTHPATGSLTHPATGSLTHPATGSLTHPATGSLTHPTEGSTITESKTDLATATQKDKQKEKKDISSKFDNLGFSMNSKLNSEQKKDELNNSSITKHYKVLKFFARLSSTILDQAIILGLTFLYFLFLIKPNMIKTPYSYIEGITDFIINDNFNFKSLLIGYFLITLIYYTIFNIIIKSTPFNYLFGYKIYRNDNLASPIVLIFRNLLMITLNLLLLFPYLFMLVSDDKQTLYDKIFKTYFLKEN